MCNQCCNFCFALEFDCTIKAINNWINLCLSIACLMQQSQRISTQSDENLQHKDNLKFHLFDIVELWSKCYQFHLWKEYLYIYWILPQWMVMGWLCLWVSVTVCDTQFVKEYYVTLMNYKGKYFVYMKYCCTFFVTYLFWGMRAGEWSAILLYAYQTDLILGCIFSQRF